MGVTGFTLLPLYFTPIPASRAQKVGPLPDREQQVRAMVELIPSHEQAHWSTHCWRGPICRRLLQELHSHPVEQGFSE